MTGEGWTQAVRRQLGLGRVLPLGGPEDGAWLAESAADGALRQMADRVAGVRLGTVRIGAADPAGRYVAAVPAPPSALPPGPLRITAEFAAAASAPLPPAADRLRAALSATAAEVGLVVAEVDLRVTALLEKDAADAAPGSVPPEDVRAEEAAGDSTTDAGAGTDADADGDADGDEARVARAVLAVPGVARLTGVLGRAVHIEQHAAAGSLPRRHARVELATDRGHRALDVALAVRAAVGAALPDHPSVAVLVTEVG